MDALYIDALRGKLKSPSLQSDYRKSIYRISNLTSVKISIWWVDALGCIHSTYQIIDAEADFQAVSLVENQWHVLRASDGSFVSVLFTDGGEHSLDPFHANKNEQYLITGDMITPPNAIAKVFPEFNEDTWIPADTSPVCVGAGTTIGSNDSLNLVVRSQYWKLTQSSVTVPPHSTSVASLSVSTGMESTTSSQSTVSSSVSTSASAGWGPISASISASLSKSTTNFHQLVVSSQTTRFESVTIENKTDQPQTYFSWQLMDIVTVFNNKTLEPLASIISSLSPPVIRSHNIGNEVVSTLKSSNNSDPDYNKTKGKLLREWRLASQSEEAK